MNDFDSRWQKMQDRHDKIQSMVKVTIVATIALWCVGVGVVGYIAYRLLGALDKYLGS